MSSHIFTPHYCRDIWMYFSGLIFFSSKYHNIHEGLIKLNSVFVPRAVVKLCQISKNYEYTTKLQIQQYKMRAAVKFWQISKVIGMYLSELLNVFVKFHICDACLSNSARSQGSSEWEGVCFVRRGVKISRARQVSVYININTKSCSNNIISPIQFFSRFLLR